jgi:hypothetical protein
LVDRLAGLLVRLSVGLLALLLHLLHSLLRPAQWETWPIWRETFRRLGLLRLLVHFVVFAGRGRLGALLGDCR